MSSFSAVRLAHRHAERRGRMWSARAAFTLVELLVVIGVIAVLIGILMPALSKAREQSKRTVCASNLHMIGAAYANYAANHKGKLPPNLNWIPHCVGVGGMNDSKFDIRPILLKYGGDKRMFYCPSDNWRLRHEHPEAGSWDVRSNGGYYYCSYLILSGFDGSDFGGAAHWINGAVRPTRLGLKNSAEIATSGDRMYATGWAATRPSQDTPHHSRRGYLEHAGGNILYLDGHAAWRDISDVKPRLQGYAYPANWTVFW